MKESTQRWGCGRGQSFSLRLERALARKWLRFPSVRTQSHHTATRATKAVSRATEAVATATGGLVAVGSATEAVAMATGVSMAAGSAREAGMRAVARAVAQRELTVLVP